MGAAARPDPLACMPVNTEHVNTESKAHTKPRTKPKLKPAGAGPNKAVRTVHMCVLITVYNCGRQHSTEQF